MQGSTPSGVTILTIHPFRGTHDTRCISNGNGSCYRNITLFSVYLREDMVEIAYAALEDSAVGTI